MNEIDRLKMERRRIEVEIKRLEDKLRDLKETKSILDRQINTKQQSGNVDEAPFKTSLFG